MKLRPSRLNEVDILNDLAIESEAFWGEDENYMTLFKENYLVTESMIKKDYVFLLEEESEIIGFFAIIARKKIPELHMFYIKKSYMGKGYGKLLWSKMLTVCKDYGIKKITLVASHDVERFYEKLGSKAIEKIDSSLKVGRIVTRYEYVINK